MLRKKRERLMLNNLTKLLSLKELLVHARIIPVILFTFYLAACSVSPDNSHIEKDQAKSGNNKLYLEAVAEMKSGNNKSAQILLNKIIQQHPDFSNAYVNLAILHIKMNMFKKAEATLNQALKSNPNNIYALNQLGYLYRHNGDFSKAKESYLKAININSDYPNAHINLGILYDLYLYDLENAVKQYKIYHELNEGKDKKVEKWIFELERRLQKTLTQK